ncbi:MAG: RIP metalloprotease RseP [Firmicutes bacterium]|nr:RIP metalloprotease RseP [Bacillota bacterium]
MSIVYTLIILCVLVLVHEFGHFAVAKKTGVLVEEFAIGMGPQLLGWQKGETEYSLRLLPIGGYVKMVGEDGESDNPRAFCNKTVWERMAITFAGPLMNMLVAIIFFLVAFMYFGTPASNGLIGTVGENSPAEAAGIVPGDVIVSLNDTEIDNWDDLSAFMAGVQPGDELTVGYLRGGEEFSASAVASANEEGRAVLGVTQGIAKADVIGSLKLGFAMTVEFTVLILQSLWQMVAGTVPVEVAGPVGMVSMVGEYANVGLMYLFMFTGMLSVNLGVMNLLPIPALDGGRLFFQIIEAVRGKAIDPDKEATIHLVGFVLLMLLMLTVTFMDIEKLMQ